MVHSRDDDASTEIPGADRLEQEQPVDPTADEDVDWPTERIPDVDEADQFEQSQPVLHDPDEEYVPDAG